MAPPVQRRVLIVGGGFAGLCCARDLGSRFLVTVVDAKEYFEYTPGVLRAYVKPEHFDALTFHLQPVIESKMGCKFIWGQVTEINGKDRTAKILPMFSKTEETLDFDYCIISSGCSFGVFDRWGESLWFPTIHQEALKDSSWPQLDERFLEGRRRHILEEYEALKELNRKEASILIVGAGFIGVEWATELRHFFPALKITIIDFLPQCLGPLPSKAAEYCAKYMTKVGISQFYSTKYDAESAEFWRQIGLPSGADKTFVCIGVKATNYFMPKEVLSEKGPGGGGWILMEQTLAVKTRDDQMWAPDDKGRPRVFAIGDCNYSCVEAKGKALDEWPIPPIPKISYPGEEEAVIACRNIENIDKLTYLGITTTNCGAPLQIANMHWPWGSGMFATSLGPNDACFVAGANHRKGTGLMCLWGRLSAWQKAIIEFSKVDECKYGIIGRCIWHFVHHTPVHVFGGGPRWGY